jgi:putative DNA primase/helicase
MLANLDRAREALQAIPPDLPRDEWVRAGMAAQAAGLGFDDFNEWSAGAGNYDERAALDTWRSIKPGKGIGEGTLYRMAAEHGGYGKRRERPSKAPARPVEPAKAPRPGMSAAEVWARCRPATEAHGYIVKKDGRPEGLRVVPEGDPLRIKGESVAGCLVVPVLPLAGGEPVSLVFVPSPEVADRWKAKDKPGKLNLKGAPMDGVFIVGELVPGGIAYVCEGIATAWACWKATGFAAVVAFGWSNVRRVAAELRERDPAARLVLVPDKGMEEDAARIARAVGAAVAAMPLGEPSNFDANDYA